LSSIYSRSTDELEKFVIQKRLKNIRQEINGYSWEERFTAGRLDLALGSYRQAREELLSVLAESPYWPKTYFELAALSLREGRNSQALAEYSLLETILPATGDERLNPDHREALDGYRQLVFTEEGDVYFSEGRYAEAADSYQKAYVANVRAFPLLKKIADTYYLRGDLPTALSYTLRGVARNPEDRTWLEAASLLYKELGDEDNARRYAEEAAR
jgi:tetratricopeptide (TPR) repeat protein